MRLECSNRQTIPPLQTAVVPFSEKLPRRQSRRTLFWKHRWRCKGGCARWQDGGHLRATGGKSGRSIAAQTAPRCHGASEKTHKQTSTFYIYRNSLFSLGARQGGWKDWPPGPCHRGWSCPALVDWDESSGRSPPRDCPVVSLLPCGHGHQNKTWTPGRGIPQLSQQCPPPIQNWLVIQSKKH